MDTDDSTVEVQSDDHDALQGVLYMEFEGFLRAILALKEWKAVIRNAPEYVTLMTTPSPHLAKRKY